MRSTAARTAVLAAPAVLLVACTSSGPAAPTPSTVTHTVTGTVTRTLSTGPIAPVSTGPTTASVAANCPLLPTQQAAARVGMRLARIAVLHSGGKLVGCRFYALQNSPLHDSEHLPGPHQPAVQITTATYASPDAAHNAFVLDARRGTSPQQAQVGGTTAVCYQIPFYKHDHGHDWACSFNLGATKVTIKTVASSALNVIEVSRVVARALG